MSNDQTYSVDSGYAKSGVHWDIRKYKLRYTTLYEVRVNGKTTQFRSKQACYKYLEDTRVTNFKQVVAEGKKEWQQVYAPEPADNPVAGQPGVEPLPGPDGGLVRQPDANPPR